MKEVILHGLLCLGALEILARLFNFLNDFGFIYALQQWFGVVNAG